MEFNIKTPETWIKLEEEKYPYLGIVSDEDIKCINAFIQKINEIDYNIISFYHYVNFGTELLTELDNKLQEINEINELIDGKPSDEGYEDTSLVHNIYHGFTDKYGGKLYININKVAAGEKFVYTFQIFSEAKQGLVCAQATIRDINEGSALKSALDMPYIKDIVKCLFKLKEQ